MHLHDLARKRGSRGARGWQDQRQVDAANFLHSPPILREWILLRYFATVRLRMHEWIGPAVHGSGRRLMVCCIVECACLNLTACHIFRGLTRSLARRGFSCGVEGSPSGGWISKLGLRSRQLTRCYTHTRAIL